MSKKVKIPDDLYQKVARFAKLAGYSSVEEFVVHLLEKETAGLDGPDDEEKIKQRLRGLGYIS